MVYFSWMNQAEELFSPHLHTRCDVPIFFISLKQEEEKLAFLVLHLPLEVKVHSYGILSWKPAGAPEALCLFRGYVDNIQQENGVTVVYFKALQDESSWLRIASTLKSRESFCSYFFDEQDTRPESILADQPFIPYWCPVSGVCTLSHMTNSQDVFQSTDEVHVIQYRQTAGIRRLNITLKAQWIQQVQGMVDVFPWIERAFPQKVLATYTPQALKKIWPKPGELLGNSGYRVMHSELVANEHKSEFFKISKAKRMVQRYVFDGNLWLFWNFKQKRKETIQTLWNSEVPGLSLDLNWNLGAITSATAIDSWSPTRAYTKGQCVRFGNQVFECTQDHHSFVFQENLYWKLHVELTKELFLTVQSSFFLTENGRKSFEFAVQRAYVIWLKAARCRHMELKGSLQALGGITLGHQYRVSYPNGEIFTGKVTHYTLTCHQGEYTISIIVSGLHPSAFKETQGVSPISDSDVSSYATNYAQDWYYVQGKPQGRKGAEYITYEGLRPQDTYAYAQFMAGNKVLDRIEVRYTDEEQRALLEAPSNHSENKGFLRPTAIRMHFQKLKGLDVLHHTISVRMLQGLRIRNIQE